MSKPLKPNWRDSLVRIANERIICDTLLPVDSHSNRTPLLFNVRPVPDHVVDLRNVRLHAKFRLQKLVNKEWKKLENTDDEVAFYNNFGYSVFEDVHLYINGILAETAQHEYGRVSYLKNLLYHSGDSRYEAALFFNDSPGRMDGVLTDAAANMGEHKRFSAAVGGKEFGCIAPIGLDTFESNGYFPDNVSFTLRFFPAKTENCIFASDPTKNYVLKAEITHAELVVPRIKLQPSAAKTKVLTYINPKDVSSFSRSLNLNQLPSKMAIVLLSEDQLAGKQGENSLMFEHHDVKSVKVSCNGNTYPDLNGLQIDKDNGDYVEPFNALFSELGAANLPFGELLYPKNYAIFGVNLHSTHDKFGTCVVDIDFSKSPSKSLVVMIVCFFDSKFSIGANGTFKCDVPTV